MPDRDLAAEARAALEAFDTAYERAAAAIRAVPDPDEAFRIANDLAERISRLKSYVAQLRTDSAGRIWDSERMTLTSLADRIGVSTTRAHQLIADIKQRRGDDNDG